MIESLPQLVHEVSKYSHVDADRKVDFIAATVVCVNVSKVTA